MFLTSTVAILKVNFEESTILLSNNPLYNNFSYIPLCRIVFLKIKMTFASIENLSFEILTTRSYQSYILAYWNGVLSDLNP
jgi:hypothetical protein